MDVLVLIDKLDDLIHNARPVPLTDQVRVDREEIYDLLDQMRATIPEEIKQARWIVKERQEMLAEAKREAERVVKEARDQQARLISEEEVYKQAERAAEEIIEDARETERQIRLGAEDYADEILSTLEVNLEKFLAAVQRGRDRLAGRDGRAGRGRLAAVGLSRSSNREVHVSERWFSERGAGRDVAADDGPGDRGDRARRPRRGEAALRGDEARVAVHARPAGRRDRGADLVRQGASSATTASRRPGSTQPRAQLEAGRSRRSTRADRKQIAEALAATWRAHSTSGVGPKPGRLRDRRGRREAHLHDEPVRLRASGCGATGRYGPDGWGVTDEAHDWSYGREGFPLYCTHCAFMNETLPIHWIGYPVYPSDPPEDFDRDPCTWYWYKDPADIPDATSRATGSSAPRRPAAPRPRRERRCAEVARRGPAELAPGRAGRAERDPGRRLARRPSWSRPADERAAVLRRDPPGADVVRLARRSSYGLIGRAPSGRRPGPRAARLRARRRALRRRARAT